MVLYQRNVKAFETLVLSTSFPLGKFEAAHWHIHSPTCPMITLQMDEEDKYSAVVRDPAAKGPARAARPGMHHPPPPPPPSDGPNGQAGGRAWGNAGAGVAAVAGRLAQPPPPPGAPPGIVQPPPPPRNASGPGAAAGAAPAASGLASAGSGSVEVDPLRREVSKVCGVWGWWPLQPWCIIPMAVHCMWGCMCQLCVHA